MGAIPVSSTSDSVKDACSGLTSDEDGIGFNTAVQILLEAGTEVISNHHQRKATTTNQKPATLADVYGSTWLTAGHGSVALLWGTAGATTVELTHLKQPQEPVGPLTVSHSHATGLSTSLDLSASILDIAIRDGNAGITEESLVKAVFGMDASHDDYGNSRKKIRRKLDKLTQEGLLVYTKGTTGGASGGLPALRERECAVGYGYWCDGVVSVS